MFKGLGRIFGSREEKGTYDESMMVYVIVIPN